MNVGSACNNSKKGPNIKENIRGIGTLDEEKVGMRLIMVISLLVSLIPCLLGYPLRDFTLDIVPLLLGYFGVPETYLLLCVPLFIFPLIFLFFYADSDTCMYLFMHKIYYCANTGNYKSFFLFFYLFFLKLFTREELKN